MAAERKLSALAPFTAGAEASELPPSVDGGFDADAVAGDEVTSVGTAVRDSTLVDSARVSRYDALREVRAAATGAVQDPIKNGVVPRRTVHLFERKFQGRRVSLRRVVLASKVCQRPGAHRTLSRVDSRYVVQVGPLGLCVSLHPGGGQRSSAAADKGEERATLASKADPFDLARAPHFLLSTADPPSSLFLGGRPPGAVACRLLLRLRLLVTPQLRGPRSVSRPPSGVLYVGKRADNGR